MEADEDLIAAGKAIRRIRTDRGLSQEQLAERAGLHRNYIGFMERGERNASLKTLCTIARSLDITIGELLSGVPFDGRLRRDLKAKKR